jgi:hypothetical protein
MPDTLTAMRVAAIALLLLFLSPVPAYADNCAAAWEQSARPYALIARDVLTYGAMFDNYDRLCSKNYPDEIKALQPDADRLRAQVKKDASDAQAVMKLLFRDVLPQQVPTDCRKGKAVKKIQATMIKSLNAQALKMARRLQRSGKSLPDPKEDLKTCEQLPEYAPVIRKTLGPSLDHPLLEMSALNSEYITGTSSDRAQALADYRAMLAKLPPSKQAPK